MMPGDLLSAFPHRQFHTLPGLLDSWAALPNSYPNALRAMQGGSLYHFYDGLWYDPAERRTHDLPCERRTRYRLSQPDTVRTACGNCPSAHEIGRGPAGFLTQLANKCVFLFAARAAGTICEKVPHGMYPGKNLRGMWIVRTVTVFFSVSPFSVSIFQVTLCPSRSQKYSSRFSPL